MGSVKTNQPNLFLLTRSISVCFGLGCIALSYLIPDKLKKYNIISFYSSVAVACCPTIVTLSRTITPDIFATFFILLSIYMSIHLLEDGRVRNYILAGLFVGFAASCKYNAVLVGITIPIAHFLRVGIKGWKDLNLFKAALFSLIGFLITTPYAYKERTLFLFQLQYEATHYSTGHPGMEGNTLLWYLNYLWENLNFLFVFALLQIGIGWYRKDKGTILFSSFFILYFGFISTFVVRNDRTILPAIPPILILSGFFFETVFNWSLNSFSKIPKISKWALHALPFLFVLPLIFNSIVIDRGLYNLYAKKEAIEWIPKNIPEGSKIALERYSPFINPEKYSISALSRLIENDPEWYIKNRFEFIIASKSSYERYYKDQNRYRKEIQKYDEIFKTFILYKTFIDEKDEIRIYRVQK